VTEVQKEFLLTLSYVYLQNNKQDRASTLLRALKTSFPDDPQVARCLAFVLVNEGRGADALSEMEAGFAFEADPELKEVSLLLRAQALWLCGKSEEARHSLSRLRLNNQASAS
jgi:predicted Zn-dependent protease